MFRWAAVRQCAWEVRWPRVIEVVERLTAAGATVIAKMESRAGPTIW